MVTSWAVSQIDLSDPRFWGPFGERDAAFELLRRERPVAFFPEPAVPLLPPAPASGRSPAIRARRGGRSRRCGAATHISAGTPSPTGPPPRTGTPCCNQDIRAGSRPAPGADRSGSAGKRRKPPPSPHPGHRAACRLCQAVRAAAAGASPPGDIAHAVRHLRAFRAGRCAGVGVMPSRALSRMSMTKSVILMAFPKGY